MYFGLLGNGLATTVGVVDDYDRRLPRNSRFSSRNSNYPLSLITPSLNEYKYERLALESVANGNKLHPAMRL